ncbi:type 1 glutamine amidotransferase [Streptomyces lonarensis]|uniref:Type 1 glutamine amidotransferase n=1 Tax=Streptomyces lonarensis TaxID=700599 RepID=A0A7X6HZG5_9ACTN|nr:type 1 glutamine amidotransferase [Streptomyces lonarensis]NJQ06631.1 type 1 glutamine amidotransferase [Streptomyces lonarensis]
MDARPARLPVLVVQHGPQGGPRRVGVWLAEAGLELRVVHGHAGDDVPERPDGHAAVVVLGGGYLPDDDHRAPWLAPTRRLVAAALDTGVPVLGICLGGQLLAHVAGGTVEGESGAPEFGSTRLTLRPEAADDPLFHGLPAEVTAIERHVDRITVLPPGAHWLMESRVCPHQAFRVGATAWGTQFHPEVPADRLAEWDPEPLRRRGLDPDELARRAAAAEPAAQAVWRKVTDRFARVVAETARSGRRG